MIEKYPQSVREGQFQLFNEESENETLHHCRQHKFTPYSVSVAEPYVSRKTSLLNT